MLLNNTGRRYILSCNGQEMRYLQVALQNMEAGTRPTPKTNRNVQRMLRVIDDALPKGKVVSPR